MTASAKYELVVKSAAGAGRTFEVRGPVSFGTATGNTVRMTDPQVQPSHVVVEPFGERLRVRHVGQGGVTLVNGAPITTTEVAAGAVLQFGRVELLVRLVAAAGSTQHDEDDVDPARDATHVGATPTAAPVPAAPPAPRSSTANRGVGTPRSSKPAAARSPTGPNDTVLRPSGTNKAASPRPPSGSSPAQPHDTLLRPSGTQNPALQPSARVSGVRGNPLATGAGQQSGNVVLGVPEDDLPPRAFEPTSIKANPSGNVVLGEVDDGEPPQAYEPTVMKQNPTSGQLNDGDVIDGRYRIVTHLAAGGMGEVYRVEHVELGKTFALKVMKRELSADQEFVDRFKREAVASSRIGQHNIVDIFDFGRTGNGRFYFVMEFLDGPTLSEIIRDERVLTVPRAANLLQQIARALGAAHQQGIVHRDLKPENVIVLQRDQGDFAKVVDFGVAKVSDRRGEGGQTAYGVVVGTPQYMSPEQAAGLPVDARSDIYSLGLIAWELLAGHAVFSGETPSMVMAAHINTPAPELVPGLPDTEVPEALQDTIMRMLEKKREARPQSMQEVIDVLEEVLTEVPGRRAATGRVRGVPPEAPAVAQPTRRLPSSGRGAAPASQPVDDGEPLPAPARSRLPLVLGGVAVLAVVVVGAALALRPGEATPTPVVAAPGKTPPVTPPPKPDPTPTPTPTLTPQPERVQLKLTSTPEGAEVFDGDTLIGTTPLNLGREKGKALRLIVKKPGFVDATRAVSPEGDLSLDFELAPVKKAAPTNPTTTTPKPPAKPDGLRDAPY